MYKMTGEVLACGKYLGSWTDDYYITLDAEGAFPGVDVHCYFSEPEWFKSPDIDPGDRVTLYGYFNFNSFGWNFDGCSFESPAGVFTIDDVASDSTVNDGPESIDIPATTIDVEYGDFVGSFDGDVPDCDGLYIELSDFTLYIDCFSNQKSLFYAEIPADTTLARNSIQFEGQDAFTFIGS